MECFRLFRMIMLFLQVLNANIHIIIFDKRKISIIFALKWGMQWHRTAISMT